MKHLFHIIIIIIIALCSKAMSQQYSNHWINYGSQYYKMQVVEEGIYRIDISMLVSAGVPVTSLDPRNFQIFCRGKEQYIYVKGENDGIFDHTDYIEFYATKNDGTLDTGMYNFPSSQLNPYYSLINDTNAYFLTWNNSISNRRLSIENDVGFSLYSPETWCVKPVLQLFTSQFSYGEATNGPWYNQSEGWFDYRFGKQSAGAPTSVTKTISTPNPFSGGPSTRIRIALSGSSNATSSTNYNHHLGIDFLGISFDTLYSSYKNIAIEKNVASILLSSSFNMSFSIIDDQNATTDLQQLSYILVEYPHSFDFEGSDSFKFYVPDGSAAKSFLTIYNFNGGSSPVLYDLTNMKRMTVVESAGVYRTLVPNSGGEKTCYLVSENNVHQVNNLHEVSFTDYSVYGFNSDYIIISHPKLWSSAQAYSSYRSSTGFTPLLADINQLYDQFAYGINKHPEAIRRFIEYLAYTYDSVPKYLFIIGKSIHANTTRNYPNYYALSLVPSYGFLSSDNLLTSGLGNTQFEPLVPTGRIAANNNSEVTTYFNKIVEYESAVPALWMKNVAHFGGGGDATQQQLFANYLSYYESIIEDTLFGGYVSSFYKTSSAPMQITQSDSITNVINTGITLMTFFGHGSSSGFDINIDHPDAFQNEYRYPFILANSCLAGDIHQTGSSISEEWVFEPEKGSIGFLATIDQSYDYTLHGFSSELYKNIAYKNYGKPIGDCIKNTIKIYQALGVYGSHLINTCEEFTLHGDPAVILNSFDLPDLVASPSNIKTIPTDISTEIDSFDVRVVITNIGIATTDTFIVAVTRTLPGGDTLFRLVERHGCFYADTFTVRFPVDRINGIGINSICATADAEGWVTEYSELNNTACLNFSIYSGDLIPVWPYEFAIYPNNTVILKASTGNPFITSQTSIFQIDTTDLFNSSLLDSLIITHPGGVVEWPAPMTLTDSTVYFWRVSKLPSGTDNYNWKESSFIYITGRTGWSQAHHFQFKKDTYQYIVYDKPGRAFDYINTPIELYCHTNSWGGIDVAYYLNSVKIDYSCCYPYSAIIVAIIDPETLIPWTSDRNNYGHVDYPKCYSRIRPDNYFVFWPDSLSLENMATLIRDTVPDGHYILLYNYGNGNYPNWPPGAIQAVNNLGGSQVQSVPSGYPYIFFCQKGDPSSAIEEIGSSTSSEKNLKTDIPTNFVRGNITSTVIGPSTYWETLHWRQTPSESMSEDSVSLTIKGVRLSGQDTLLMTIPFDTTDIYDLFNTIPGSEYPYLVMNLFSSDDSTRTPAQLKKWQLTYEEMPETAINPSLGYCFHKDTVQEGEDITLVISTENISSHNMDSLLVTYMHQDRNNNLHLITTKRLRTHPSGDVITDTVTMNTIGYGGLNSIWVEFNPINSNTGYYDQLEQYHFNNIAQRFFYVQSDITNPVLDVTFDGFHILDGDIISAKPQIVIQLKDENKYLALNDPGLFRVYLTRPGSDQEELIPFADSAGNEILKWTPANLPHNSCKIEYFPVLTTDGIYKLRVGATDASSNESGDIDYKISFEVINKPTITNIFNYPNPFSTSTRFVFELTGSEIPSDLQIKIFTVTGKLVKALYLEDLGNVHVGRNISEYAWDGRDMFGDQLANGVYFFVVTAQIDGQDIEKRDTQTDQYFKKGVGKMYLMR